jgi:hypothetical protein
MIATTKQDLKTGEWFPAIQCEDGRIVTYSPTSFDQDRALEIANDILVKMLTDKISKTL